MAFTESQNRTCLILSLVDCLESGAVDFRKIGTIVDSESNNGSSEALERKSEDIIWCEIEENQLQDKRSSPHYLDL